MIVVSDFGMNVFQACAEHLELQAPCFQKQAEDDSIVSSSTLTLRYSKHTQHSASLSFKHSGK